MLIRLRSFAFWLRSSVVSVLFSLISETSLRRHFKINLIFVTSSHTAGLAYVWGHSVARIALPRADANTNLFFVVQVVGGRAIDDGNNYSTNSEGEFCDAC